MEKIKSEILAYIAALDHVQVMQVGDTDILMCVKVGIKRNEEINGSGYNPVTVPYYYNFGQLVWLEIGTPDKNPNIDRAAFGNKWASVGAICTHVVSTAGVMSFLENIHHYLKGERKEPSCWVMI